MNTMIHRRLDALEVIANLSTASTESVTTRIENLIEHFASHEDESNRVREIVASIIKTRKHYSDEITSEEIFDWIFWPTVLGMLYKKNGSSPKHHHWVPSCYSSNFGSGHRSKRQLVETRFVDGVKLERIVSDEALIHGVDENGDGFYDLTLEYAFSHIEGAYAAMMSHNDFAVSDLRTGIAFMITQSLRTPHPASKDFRIRTIPDFLLRIEEIVENIDSFYARIESVGQDRLAFAPYSPSRVFRDVTGKEFTCFPLSYEKLLIVSEDFFSRKEARKMINTHMDYMIKNIERTGNVLYGLKSVKRFKAEQQLAHESK